MYMCIRKSRTGCFVREVALDTADKWEFWLNGPIYGRRQKCRFLLVVDSLKTTMNPSFKFYSQHAIFRLSPALWKVQLQRFRCRHTDSNHWSECKTFLRLKRSHRPLGTRNAKVRHHPYSVKAPCGLPDCLSVRSRLLLNHTTVR